MDTIAPLWLWASFIACVFAALFVDFVVLRKQGAHGVTPGEALRWSLAWIALGLAFDGLIWWAVEREHGAAIADAKALEYLTGYLIEKSLAVDNIFVFLLIFNFFRVPQAFQKRVLMIGVVGALVLRTVMILAGAWLVAQFHAVLCVFGAFLVVTGIKMAWTAGQEADMANNPALRLLRRWMPVSAGLDGERLITVENGRRIATPLMLVVALIGVTDVIFAVDSIPAIFAITTDTFIVLTSNIFAVLGLRALYFLLAAMAERFHKLGYGLALVLIFVGAKMLLAGVITIPTLVALGVVFAILAASVVWSLLTPPPR